MLNSFIQRLTAQLEFLLRNLNYNCRSSGDNGTYGLREPAAAYKSDFGPENSYFWNNIV